MAKSSSQNSWSKKEREKQKAKEREEKAARKKERKDNSQAGKSLEDMMAYVDEFGNITDTPPDPGKQRKEVKAEDIVIGVPRRAEEDPADAFRQGSITFFNESRGFGFIKDGKTGESLFVHVNDLSEPVKEHDKVNFEVEMGHKGPQAVRVKKATA